MAGELYNEFTKWARDRREHAKKQDKIEMKSGAFGWYNPKGEFDLTECADAYKRLLKEGGMTGEVMSVRFQAAQIMACKQAWLHRHCSIARLLAHGYTENVVEANGLYDKYLTDLPSSYSQNAKKQRQEKEGK